jgi:hypothetical protein
MHPTQTRSAPAARRALTLTTAIIILCVASNPTLATLVPLLDAIGLDVMAYLLSAQIAVLAGEVALPWLRALLRRHRTYIPATGIHVCACVMGGYLRQLAWHLRNVGPLPVRYAIRY